MTAYPSALLVHVVSPAALLRVLMVATSVYWWQSCESLAASVGAICVALSLVPILAMREGPLRTACDVYFAVLLAAHVVLGMAMGLYESSVVYDKVVHALGFAAMSWLLMVALTGYCHRQRLYLPSPLFVGLVLGLVVTAGTAWEVFEFAIDRTGLFQTQKGLTDTMLDLIADAVGALVAISLFKSVWVRRMNGAQKKICRAGEPGRRGKTSRLGETRIGRVL